MADNSDDSDYGGADTGAYGETLYGGYTDPQSFILDPVTVQRKRDTVVDPIIKPLTATAPEDAMARLQPPVQARGAQLQPQGAQLAQAAPGSPVPPNPMGTDFFGRPITKPSPVDPNSNTTDSYAQDLRAQRDKAKRFADNPLMQFLMGDTADEKRKEALGLDEKLQAAEDRKQGQLNVQKQADNEGVPRADQTYTQDKETLVQNQIKNLKSGDADLAMRAQDNLNATGHKAEVAAYQNQMLTAMQDKLDHGNDIQTKLDAAPNEEAYAKKRAELIGKDGKKTDKGFEIPPTKGAWDAGRAQRVENGQRANIALAKIRQERANQNDYTPQPNKDVAEQQKSGTKMYNGATAPNTTAVVHLGNGSIGNALPSGSNDFRNYGKPDSPDSWNTFDDAVQKANRETIKDVLPPEDMRKYRNLVRTDELLTHDKNGKLLPPGKMNTNPNALQVLAETLTAEYREGGGANASMMRLEAIARGWSQNTFDDMVKNFSGLKGVVTGQEGKYLTKLTEEQKRFVLDFTMAHAVENVGQRLAGVAENIGMHGGNPKLVGLEKDITSNPYFKEAYDRARDTQIYKWSQEQRVVRDHDSVMLGLPTEANKNIPGSILAPISMSALPSFAPELTPGAAPSRFTLPGSEPAQPPAAVVPPPPARVIPGPTGGPPAAAPPPVTMRTVPAPYNPRAGQYGGTMQVPVAAPAAAPAPPAAGAFPAAGAAPVPFAPGGPAAPQPAAAPGGGALRPLAATPAAAAIQALAGPPAAPAAPVQTAQLPASWGVGGQSNVTPGPQGGVVATPGTPSGPRPGSPAAAAGVPPPAPVAPAGTPPPTVMPAPISRSPIAQTVYTVAGETAFNATDRKNPVVGKNVATIATSAAQSESSFNANTLHDPDKQTGLPRGQGLFGHNAERLAAMQKFAGVKVTGQPGEPIPANVQASFFAREMMDAAETDPFIKSVLNNPNATAEDLTRVQMRMEKPEGYKKGQEEKGKNWNERLANTQALMGGGGGAAQPAAAAGQPPAAQPVVQANQPGVYRPTQKQTPEEAAQYAELRQKRLDSATQSGAHAAPAVLSAAGGVIGSAVPGVGTVAGGALGGVAGGEIEHYFTAPKEQQNARGYTEAGVWSGLKGAATNIPGIGLVGTGARVVGSGAVPAAKTWYETGDAGKVYDEGMKGLAEGAVGELFGRGLGIGHQVWNELGTPGKAKLMAAGEILSREEPKIAGAGGKMVDNPKWKDAEAQVLKLHQDPETVKYNWEQTKKVTDAGGIPKNTGEALIQRPSEVAKAKIGREQYDPIKQEITEAPKSKGAITMVHDPVAAVGKGPIPDTQEMRDLAKSTRTMMVIGKNGVPPKNIGEVWQNQVDARSRLLKMERETLDAPTHTGQQDKADALRAMADKVRDQQRTIVEKYLPKEADRIMANLEKVDKAYREASLAGGKDIVQKIAKGGDDGRAAQAAFNKLVGNDPAAKRAMEAAITLHNKGDARAKTVGWLGAGATIAHFGASPITGGMIGAARIVHLLQQHMVEKAAGKTATFDSMIKRVVSDKAKGRYARASSSLAPVGTQALKALDQSENADAQ